MEYCSNSGSIDNCTIADSGGISIRSPGPPRRIVWCMCGSFCTIPNALAELERLTAECEGEYELIPVLSESVATLDTRFTRHTELVERVESLCRRRAILTITDAEPLGPTLHPELCVIAPLTGNTLSKLAHAVTDGAVTMAAKSVLRGGKPLLLSLASNDALGANLENIGRLACRRGICFVPMKQDDVTAKPYSLVADYSRLCEAIGAALDGRQLRPLFL